MAKRNVFGRWQTRSKKFKIACFIGMLLLMLIAPYLLLSVIFSLVTHNAVFSFYGNKLLWGLYGLIEAGLFVAMAFEYRIIASKRVLKANKDLEDSHFMTLHEIEQDASFQVVKFDELEGVKDGLLVMADRVKNNLNIVIAEPIHTAIIATTGTGKSAAYVSPFIEIMSRTKTKPCIVVTDPKGELYERHANTLETNGYHVHLIDMSNTYISTLWNPFNDVIRKTERITEPIVLEKGKYVWGGRTYSSYADAEQRRKEYGVKLNDEIRVDLQDLIYTMCPAEAAQDKSWQQGARDLILAMAIRMWEDVRDGFLTADKFNLYNLWWNLTEYATNEDECAILKEYINEISDSTSRAPGMANTVLVSQERTMSSYLGSVNQYLHWLADGGVAQLTSGNEIEFSEWDDEPNVLFIKIPTAKEGRRSLVTLMLVQLYKALLEKSELNAERGDTSDACLKRNCFFLMDEFGALPKIHEFGQKITFSRSYKIFFMPVIQSYEQLDAVYGQNDANIIRSNCNVKIFMGTTDPKTLGQISDACGKKKTAGKSFGESKDLSINTSAQSVPLIYPSELDKLNEPKNNIIGNAIVLVNGTYPILAKTTPYFKAMDIYKIVQGARAKRKDFMIFNEEENRYNVADLIYLQKSFEEEAAEETLEQVTQQVVETTMRDLVINKLKKQITEVIKSLESDLADDDFIRLGLAKTVDDKIAILEELADKAFEDGNIFLVTKIQRVQSFLKYNASNMSEADGQDIRGNENEEI